MSAKSGELSVSESGFLLTIVSDGGSGIKQEDFGGLFRMFNNTSKGVFTTKGIGLGLTTAKSLTTIM